MSDVSKTYWNKKAEAWSCDADRADSLFRGRSLSVAELVRRHVPKCRSLDVGCGSGKLMKMLLEAGYDAYGADLSEKMVEQSIRNLSDIAEDAERRVRVSGPDGLPFDSEFGLITAIGIFPYVPDFREYLSTLSTALRADGFLCATCTIRSSRYSLRAAKNALKTGDLRSVVNLLRTGIWSGGNVERKQARQCYSARSFDRLFDQGGYRHVADFSWYGYPRFDRSPLSRRGLARLVARHRGWSYVGLWQKKGP